jgi:virginiamycin B lyase
MTSLSTPAEMRRARSTDSRKSRPGRLFWTAAGDGSRLEERVMLTLTLTSFPIPLVQVVQPAGIVTGPDGNLWFTEKQAGRIGRMTPSGTLTEFALPKLPPQTGAPPGALAEPPSPQGITAGPDGALWFTTSNSLIGRISTFGTITEFKVDGLTQANSTIITGPDGNLWFTGVAGEIGRITPSGTVTKFAVDPTASSPPTVNGITAGPDGALWFTGLIGELGRMTTAGTVTEFALPTIPPPSGASPETQPTKVTAAGITTGPDGALWFTGVPNEIGRITTSGKVTEFPTPDQIGPGRTISKGPDGNLWFTLAFVPADPAKNPSIGRITLSGNVTAVRVPGTFSSIGGLTAGPVGNLWFTEQEDGITTGQQPALGAITPSGVTTLHTLPQGTTLDPIQGVPVSPGSLTVGPDGNLWFVDNTGIGRMTTDGQFQQFDVHPSLNPVQDFGTNQITVGLDGAIWFCLNGTAPDGFTQAADIGRITTAGAITLYPLRNGTSAGAIATGPDGNVWFTENYTDPNSFKSAEYIARITPNGQVKKFNLHANGVNLTGITTGPDHNLWFTGIKGEGGLHGLPFIGRITTRGQVRIFDVPAGNNPPGSYGPPAPASPISGPDGKIWFETMVNNNWGIARISTRGKLQSVAGLDGWYSSNLATTPGGGLFFIDDSSVGIATRSGSVTTQSLPGSRAALSFYSHQLAAGPGGSLWFTSDQSIVKIAGLETPNGGLNDAQRPRKAPDRVQGAWTNVTKSTRPTFVGLAQTGAELTLLVRKQGESQPVSIGQVHASTKDGSWKLTSSVALSNGNYEVTAVQQGNPSPSVLYSLEPDSSGNLSNALVIAARSRGKPAATPKATIALNLASSRRSSRL